MENNIKLIDLFERLTRAEMKIKALHKRLDKKENAKEKRNEMFYRGLIAVGAAILTATIIKIWSLIL